MVVGQEHYDALTEIAVGVQGDILGDNPEADVEYDLYIEEESTRGGPVVVGVIDMGDSFQRVYLFNGDEGWIEDWQADPCEVRDSIVRKRGAL